MTRRIAWVVVALCLPSVATARNGWYLDFTAGPGVHVEVGETKDNFPDGVHAPAEATFLNELDVGYSFAGSFTLGIGLELNSFVDAGYKLDFKWSFLEDSNIQPFTYFCLHGGITDVTMGAVHSGLGIDYFLTDNFFFLVDARLGPSLVSADPPKNPKTGDREYEVHMEGALSFGIGYVFGVNAAR